MTLELALNRISELETTLRELESKELIKENEG